MIQKVIVLGGGSAGFLAAIGLKTHIPNLEVKLLRSPSIGIIGVGEGSQPDLLNHLHGFLGINPAWFHQKVQPTYKLGVNFLWGPRDAFYYSFSNAMQSNVQGLSRPTGYYAFEDMSAIDHTTALMAAGKCFSQQTKGVPDLRNWSAYHVENEAFAKALEEVASQRGVIIQDCEVAESVRSDQGIGELILDDGQKVTADLFVDCSGFRSELLGKTLEEPFVSYEDSLFCDRAIAGGWKRAEKEPVKPYTTAETYSAGWSWKIDHDKSVNRGYVYSSSFISDEEAEAEFRKKNPRIEETRLLSFPSGRYRNSWVGNVVALGNSAGFVEPLEATALFTICNCSRILVGSLLDNALEPTPSTKRLYNALSTKLWDEIRDFLAIHYRYNTRLDTPFWEHCRKNTALHGAEPIVEYYKENGPTSAFELMLLSRETSIFRLDGFYAILLGQKVAHERNKTPDSKEARIWKRHQTKCRKIAQSGMTTEEGLSIIRSPQWQWTDGFYKT